MFPGASIEHSKPDSYVEVFIYYTSVFLYGYLFETFLIIMPMTIDHISFYLKDIDGVTFSKNRMHAK